MEINNIWNALTSENPELVNLILRICTFIFIYS